MHHLWGEKQQPLLTHLTTKSGLARFYRREMEGGRGPPSLVDFGDSAIKKMWLPWPPATAHKHPKHQRAVSLQPPAQWWREVKWERERGKETERGKSEGSWGGAECIFMSLYLSSFWVVWPHGHKFSPPPFLHLPCFLLARSPSKSPPYLLLLPVCKLSFQFPLAHPHPGHCSSFISWMFLPVWARPLTPALRRLSVLLPFSSLHLFFFLFIVSQHYHSPPSVIFFLSFSIPPPPPPPPCVPPPPL